MRISNIIEHSSSFSSSSVLSRRPKPVIYGLMDVLDSDEEADLAMRESLKIAQPADAEGDGHDPFDDLSQEE